MSINRHPDLTQIQLKSEMSIITPLPCRLHIKRPIRPAHFTSAGPSVQLRATCSYWKQVTHIQMWSPLKGQLLTNKNS